MIALEWGIIFLLLLLVLDLTIAITRVSLLSARPLRLLAWKEQSAEAVARVMDLIEDARLRPALRLGQTLARLLLAGITLMMVDQAAGESGSAALIQFAAILGVALFLLIAEFTVEGSIQRQAERWALRTHRFGRGLVLALTPFIYLPIALLRSRWPSPAAAQMTEDELRTWVESEPGAGGLEREERQMIYSIFQFTDTLVREIMVPRMDMLALDVHTPLGQAVDALVKSGHSRVPVYEGDVDNIIGLLYAKDLLRARKGSRRSALREMLRPATFVPETKKADELLAEMQAQRIHLAIVVDEYGGVSGLVTLEDIIEEIIGEIRDEYDAGEELLYQPAGANEFIFHGGIDLDHFNQVMGSDLLKDEADTLAGYLYDRLGRVPQGGESIQVNGLLLTIEQVAGRRIRRVRARRVATAPGEPNDVEHE